MFRTIVILSILLCTGAVQAQNAKKQTEKEPEDTTVLSASSIVIHRKNSGSLFADIPGSVGTVNAGDIQKLAPVSGNEVFRKIAGVHVVDEEGAGMRINIGIRGMDPDRSKGVLVLEDGIPVALNPYGEPEMYYSPVIDRMAGVEVLKGSGQIVFGPQTVGGVVNYITASPTQKQNIKFRLAGGSGGLLNTMLTYSNTFKQVGFVGTLLHKRADKLGYAAFGITDFTGKLVLPTGERSKVTIKLGVYDELSNSTYIGLTRSMFESGDQDFTLMAPDDRLQVRRYSFSAAHQLRVNDRLRFNTTIYGYTVTRNWQRQDFSASPTTSNRTGIIWGDTSVSGGAVYMRNQNAHRDRQFEVLGTESRMVYDYRAGKTSGELQAGVRYLYERAFEQRVNGKKADARSGDLVEDEIRTGNAFSVYLQNRIELNPKTSFHAGVRAEFYDYSRQIFRNTFRINNVNKVVDTNLMAGNQIQGIIPGAGVNYLVNRNLTAFAGVHRGYAPPRIKDAITNSGEVYQLEAEQSWNYEAGFRGRFKKYVSYEMTGFYMDFSNQIIPVSESSGGTGSGLVNGGRTRHQGMELAYKIHFNEIIGFKSKLCISGNHTFVQAVFAGNRFAVESGDTVNISGNFTPYAPQSFHTFSLNYELPAGFGVLLNATHVGEQFSNSVNSVESSSDGRNGLIRAYTVLDANAYYRFKKLNSTFSFGVKNIGNERYIVSRRPQGIRVGLPRYFMASVLIGL